MKPSLLYRFVRAIFRQYNFLFYRRFKVLGKENIPTDGAVLFSPNHQNSLVDPLLVGTTGSESVHSLTRSDVFDGPLKGILKQMQTLPVYRIRDGYDQLKRNQTTFEKCYALLGEKKHLMMFSEGGHHEEYFLQRLSKGSSRLAMEAQKRYPEIPVYLQAVGLNFGHHTQALLDCTIVYGNAFSLQPFLDDYLKEPSKTLNAIRLRLEGEMKACLWLPEKDEFYFERKEKINRKTTSMGFYALKEKLEKEYQSLPGKTPETLLQKALIAFFALPNLPVHLVIYRIQGLFKDAAFHGMVHYLVKLIFFPLWWCFGALIGFSVAPEMGFAFLIVCIESAYLNQKMINFSL